MAAITNMRAIKGPSTHRLLVEGETDLRVLPYLMEENGVAWENGKEPVQIKALGGITKFSKADVSSELKSSELKFLGIILDADQNANAAWKTIQGWFADSFIDMPPQIPAQGFISSVNRDGIRFGAWIMPDNMSVGMLETFLKWLVRDDHQELWSFAEKSCAEAKSLYNAPYKHVHQDKASIHTFLGVCPDTPI